MTTTNTAQEVSIDCLIAEQVMGWTRYGDAWRDKPLIVATASAGTRQLAVCRAAWKAIQERGK